MSWQSSNDPRPGDASSCDLVEHVVIPRARDLNGFEVRRALPSTQRQMVGPFIFFDQIGPAEFLTGDGLDVAPHPHIGLSTVTYLFEGEIFHRDSLGSALPIRPGELNLMTAGRGIVHSEREPAETAQRTRSLFGLQAWAALPVSHEEQAPAFVHHGRDELPRIEGDGKRVRIIMGELYGETSPAAFPHPCFYAEAVLAPGAVLPLDPAYDERAVFIVSGEIDIAGDTFSSGRLLIFHPGDRISILANSNARLMLLGGEPMDGPRHIWWNFVSSSKDRIRAAREDWRLGRYPDLVDDASEITPLPE